MDSSNSNDYLLSCCECDEEFATKEDLKVHLTLVHMENWVPYKCEKCPGMRMASVDILKAHHAMCHPNWSDKTLIYYYNDEKEAQLKELLLRSLEGQSNTPELESKDILPFGLRSTSPPSLLATSSRPCSSFETDKRTENTFEIETAERQQINPTSQEYHPAKKRLRIGRRFVCSVCGLIFTNREQASDHQCRRVTQPVTAPLEVPPKLPLTNLCPAPFIRIGDINRRLETTTRVKREVNEDISEMSAEYSTAFSLPNPLLNADTSSTPSSAPSKPVETSVPLGDVRKRPRSQNCAKMDQCQNLSTAKAKAVMLDGKNGPQITDLATMELRSKETNSVISTDPKGTEKSAESRPNSKMETRCYWRCTQSKALGCRAILHTESGGEGSERLKAEHNHRPDPDALQTKLAVEEMKVEALRTDKPTKQIVTEICAKLTEAQTHRLPSDDALMRQLLRVRRNKKAQQESQC